jgi:hypothetical protein
MDFIVISIDLESKLSKKENLGILKVGVVYPRCLDINSLILIINIMKNRWSWNVI